MGAISKEKKEERRELAPYRPWRLPHVIDDFDKFFERFWERPLAPRWWPALRGFEELEAAFPSVDIFEEENDVVVKADIPGMKKEDLDISVSDNSITISGEKRKEEKVQEKDYYRLERSYGSFSRTFMLPAEVRGSVAKAKFADGVLEVKIPKTEEAKKKEVKVKIE